ncbi:uncharacterized protein LOC113238981 [Hyposmocoma kahamanoa]|nr:uncharacterized protein LOC113238981 [Hyposmocoma kahamanoa]
MDFGNNNYICDCNCQWMVNVLVPLMNRSGISADSMICKKPRDLRGMSFAKLHELSKTLECRVSEKLVEGPGPDVAMILGIMIGILATFPLVFVTVLLWRRGFFARCRGQRLPNKYYDEEENDAF